MPVTIKLTPKQRKEVINDMYIKKEMLSGAEVDYLATKLNDKVNIPFINEGIEQKICVKAVMKIDRLLYESLPNELYGLIKDSKDGISDEEAEQMIKILSARTNKKFDIKYLPEWVEQEIFEFLLGLIVHAMRKEFRILPD